MWLENHRTRSRTAWSICLVVWGWIGTAPAPAEAQPPTVDSDKPDSENATLSGRVVDDPLGPLLKNEIEKGLVVWSPETRTIQLTDRRLFKRKDPLWRTLGTVAKWSREAPPDAAPIRVEVLMIGMRPKLWQRDLDECTWRINGVVGYLYEKQRVDPTRVPVSVACRFGP